MIRQKSVRQQELNQASPVLVFCTWHCIAGHVSIFPWFLATPWGKPECVLQSCAFGRIPSTGRGAQTLVYHQGYVLFYSRTEFWSKWRSLCLCPVWWWQDFGHKLLLHIFQVAPLLFVRGLLVTWLLSVSNALPWSLELANPLIMDLSKIDSGVPHWCTPGTVHERSVT